MDHFNRLVSEQMVTMDKLLFLQAELDAVNKLKKNYRHCSRQQILRVFKLIFN